MKKIEYTIFPYFNIRNFYNSEISVISNLIIPNLMHALIFK